MVARCRTTNGGAKYLSPATEGAQPGAFEQHREVVLNWLKGAK
jgi:hypothetical protein